MNNRPIGVFDSGLGGLSVVRQLEKFLPNEDIIYFGDTGRVPYGTRSNEIIKRYASEDVAFLLNYDVKMIIAACGTVSAVATNITDGLTVPFAGVVKPAAKAAVKVSKAGRIGVIATNAAIASGAYPREISKLDGSAEVFCAACPLLVQLVENGWISPDDEIVTLTVKRYLAPLIEKKIDTLILGCTHFPLLSETIGRVMGKDVALVDTGKEVVLHTLGLLHEENLLSDENRKGSYRFFVSDKVQNFSSIAGILLGRDIENEVSFIDASKIYTK